MKLSEEAVELAKRGNKLVYQDGQRVVKVFNSEKPAADVFNEAHNIARVQALGIRTPEVLEVSKIDDGPHAGSWALATTFVPGTTLAHTLAQTPEVSEDVLTKLVSLQVEVGAITGPALNRQKDKLIRMIDACDALDPSTRYDLHMRVDGMQQGAKVCHGDFTLSNVIVGPNDELYLCDWAHVTAGLPAVDAAMTYLLLTIEYPDLADAYLERYALASDTPKQLIHYWLPAVAAAELSRKRGYHKDVLKRWVQVTDYE